MSLTENQSSKISTPGKRITAWWKYRGEVDIIELRKLKGIVSAISIAQDEFDVPAHFIESLQGLGFEVLNLVDRSWGGFATPEERAKTVRCLMESCEKKGFDGIDLDYESQPAELREEYSALIRDLSGLLHQSQRKLSICVGFYYFDVDSVTGTPSHGFIDPVVVEACCDEVRIMCYDQNFAPGKNREPMDRPDCQGVGPVSSQPWARTAILHWSRFVSLDKVVMGLPTHSNDYDEREGGYGRHCYTSLPPAANWIVDRTWLPDEKVNLYRYQDENGNPRIFYASDSASTTALLELATEQGVSAISFWHGRAVDQEMWHAATEWQKK